MADIIEIEISRREAQIKKALVELFEKQLKITDLDVPEADDKLAAVKIVGILKQQLLLIEQDVNNGKYDNY